jgi:uncharacterized protein YegJ (DUF2314 family)
MYQRRRWSHDGDAVEPVSAAGKYLEGEMREFMWLQVTAIKNDTIYGTLDSDPIHVKSLRSGSHVQVEVQSLNDWIFTKGKGTRGGFSIEALRKAAHRRSQ